MLALAGVLMRAHAFWGTSMDLAVARHAKPPEPAGIVELARASRLSEGLGLIVKLCFLTAGIAAATVPQNTAPHGGITAIVIPVCFVVALIVLDYSSLRWAVTREKMLDRIRQREIEKGDEDDPVD